MLMNYAFPSKGNHITEVKEQMEIIGADGVHVGTVDKVEGNRIKLTKKDSGEGSHKGHHHCIDRGLVAASRATRCAYQLRAPSP
jgi:hypothetical protein